VRSTRAKQKQTAQDEKIEYVPHLTKYTNVIYVAIHDIEGHLYTDLPGRFPKTSIRGYKYILVQYDYDGNNIQVEPMNNRSDTAAIRPYTKIYDELTPKGFNPTFQTNG
jgi:hypothetical protein